MIQDIIAEIDSYNVNSLNQFRDFFIRQYNILKEKNVVLVDPTILRTNESDFALVFRTSTNLTAKPAIVVTVDENGIYIESFRGQEIIDKTYPEINQAFEADFQSLYAAHGIGVVTVDMKKKLDYAAGLG